MRVVSLVPAGTEMVAALGLARSLVAVTHDCDYPPEVRALPRVTRSTIAPGSTSGAIDAAVRAAAAHGESTFHLDAEALRGARPDLIVGQTLCAVCAVTLDSLPALRARVVPLEASSLEGMFDDVARVAAALGARDAGARLVTTMRARLAAVGERVAGLARPRVACLEWLDPLFNGGHWVPEQVALAGGIDVLGAAGERSREISFAELARADPDAIVLMPCGFDATRASIEAEALTAKDEFAELRAARSGRVYAVDGAAYFSRPGPRLVDGVEVLAALLHPEISRTEGVPLARRVATYTPRAN
ncbi:MAG TPA: cobalamin-binding protein [Candidatus Dormibacteraeota bacterium]|nr:cobalamin-binding protein [Candidatus Dormibacteraeota bacterium]